MLNYFLLINIVSFIVYGIDKFFSIRHWYRISEFILLCFGFIGGVVGSLVGMYFFRHKTRKVKFKIYLFLFSVLWLMLFYFYYNGYLNMIVI